MKIICLLISLIIATLSYSKTLTVGKGKQFVSIKQAIKAASDGDSIVIYSGRYSEGEIIIDKQLFIKGINWPVIDGKHKFQIITVTAGSSVVEGLQVINGGYSSMFDYAAIKVVNCDKVTVKNNRLFNTTFGIYLQNVNHCFVLNNEVKGNPKNEIESGNAIHCWKANHITIQGNTLTGHRDGIYFEFVTESVIKKNTSFENIRYGLHFMFSHNNAYLNNSFINNGSGVAVMFTKGVTMIGNHFEQNWGSASYGILMKEISDSKVENNSFVKNTVGIYMEGTSRIFIKNNQFSSNGWAMRVQASCVENTIIANNFSGNSFDVGTNGDLQLNTFTGNYWDNYEGYDLNKDNIGDVPYRPVSMFSMISEKNPAALMLFRSFLVGLLDKSEKVIPAIIPSSLVDDKPSMKRIRL